MILLVAGWIVVAIILVNTVLTALGTAAGKMAHGPLALILDLVALVVVIGLLLR